MRGKKRKYRIHSCNILTKICLKASQPETGS